MKTIKIQDDVHERLKQVAKTEGRIMLGVIHRALLAGLPFVENDVRPRGKRKAKA